MSIWGAGIGAAASLLGGAMDDSGDQIEQKTEPWVDAIPYLSGDGATPDYLNGTAGTSQRWQEWMQGLANGQVTAQPNFRNPQRYQNAYQQGVQGPAELSNPQMYGQASGQMQQAPPPMYDTPGGDPWGGTQPQAAPEPAAAPAQQANILMGYRDGLPSYGTQDDYNRLMTGGAGFNYLDNQRR